MRIVLAGTLNGHGGIQTHLFWLARALLEAGNKVSIISLSGALTDYDIERADQLQKFGDFSLLTPRRTNSNQRRNGLATFITIIKDLRQLKPDIYLACGTGWNLFLPAILSLSCPVRVFHEVMSGHSVGSLDSRQAVRFGFHHVVAQASAVARVFKQQFGWSAPVPVLPAFPEPLEITASLPAVSQQSIPAGNIRAAFFGRLVPHKGALWLAQQWPRLSRYLSELHIYGTGPDQQPIKELIDSNGWSRSVECKGQYPSGQAYANLLSSYDLTLLPTTGNEGAPLVLLESMACGVPFVAYGVGGIPDYANPDCLIADSTSPESFLDAVFCISDRFASREINQSRLQLHYLENFSFQKLADQWLNYMASTTAGLSDDQH
ncbi:glycosyltransferase family 4 protein [Phragmitibacter flavus]|uniref:Glycosyltransferase family 4 protein n=1 Tax=Phragmitibacter flavus TaxID=2576071 RepID=A0A5R8KCC3_9BACT|nr:glycosyltransferase family 4 protein [Phragmitibacter flavus]TLD69952.1 glycosyltransferase family 4 protein [Phragmitibacter flavus]